MLYDNIIIIHSGSASFSWRLGVIDLYARKFDKNAPKYRLGILNAEN